MSILDANGSVACAECGRKARDERDKLLDGFHAMQQLYEDELKHALAENVKLRELVRDMMVAWWACDDERCPRHDKRCEEGKFCAFDECARDLGIEAGE